MPLKRLAWLIVAMVILSVPVLSGCEKTAAPATSLTAEPPVTHPGTEPSASTAAPVPTTPSMPLTQPATQTTGATLPSVVQPTTPAATQPTVETRPQTLPQQPTTQPATQPGLQPTVKPTEVPATQPTTVPVLPPPELPAIDSRIRVEASGVKVAQGGGARIDYSNIADGYVMVRYDSATALRLKVQVKGPSTTYTYNLTPETWTAFPLSDQNGDYRVTVCQNVTGTKYAVVLSTGFTAELTDEFAPFLRSNQYVDILAAPKTAKKAQQLVAGKTDPLKKVEAVYDFVVSTLSYDRELPATVQSGYLPVLDQVLEKKKGICFDYAALMTGMLRSQGVPTKLVVGYAGQAYHAWISVYTEDTGWIDGVIYFDGASWHRMDPTYASSGGGSQDILDYIGDGTNYTAKYFY